jgi:hypothetical protein
MAGHWLRQLTIGSAFLLVFGLAWLFAYTLAEAFLGDGGGSLVDAYWRGRLPWMGGAETLIVVGATASAVSGTLAAMVCGGWIRRLAVLPPLAVIGLWWFFAIIPFRGGVYCPDCPPFPPQPDPWAYAYSRPETTVLFLLLPALVIVALRWLANAGTRHRLWATPP